LSRAEASSGYPTRNPEALRELPMIPIRRTRDEEVLWDGAYTGEIYRFRRCCPLGQHLRITPPVATHGGGDSAAGQLGRSRAIARWRCILRALFGIRSSWKNFRHSSSPVLRRKIL